MKADAIVFGIAGSLFGLIIGWVLGSQQTAHRPGGAPVAQAAPAHRPGRAASGADRSGSRQGARRGRRAEPEGRAAARAARKYLFRRRAVSPAITWYEQALAINPNDTNVSTDLGVAYYYTNQPDRALAQFDRSLALDRNTSRRC
jgi:tetratricopeptide (TPR) repeat protein